MKQAKLIAHLCVPALVTLGTFAAALRNQPFGMDTFTTYILGGYLFYAAPHLLWAVIAASAQFSNAVRHAGFIASSVALAMIASFWLGPQDSSGLPLQWMAYWPLAAILQLVMASSTAIYLRVMATRQ